MSINVSHFIDNEPNVTMSLSENRTVVGQSSPYRVLNIQSNGDTLSIFMTSEQAEELAVTILAKLKADRKQDQEVA